jgi:hypothetical protein
VPVAVTSSGALSGVTLTQLSVGQGHVCSPPPPDPTPPPAPPWATGLAQGSGRER